MAKVNLFIQSMGQSLFQREVDQVTLYLNPEERWVKIEANDVACADNIFLKVKNELNEYYIIFELAFISYFKNVINVDSVANFKIYKSNKKGNTKLLYQEIEDLKSQLIQIDDEIATGKTIPSVVKNITQKRNLELLEFRLRNYLNEEVSYEII